MGFNGGDGMSAARHLHEWSYPVQVALIGRWERLREEPATYATILRRLAVPLLQVSDAAALTQFSGWVTRSGMIVDALLGIGVRGPVREPLRQIIEWLNRSGHPIVAADIPSGLDADTGEPQGIAVKATVTVTFGLPKHGCVMGQGPAHVGRLLVDSITIPRYLLAS
jgi:NAD(P)H-hydrate epimerase